MFNPELSGILKEIVEHKQAEVERRKREQPLESLLEKIKHAPPVRDFHSALKRGEGPVKLLAEIKAASPSAGTIREAFDPAEIAKLYETSGASAISVLTDGRYFCGTDGHLQAAREAVMLPVLRKDFTVDEYQIHESRALGCDAILLMAQVLNEETFAAFYQKARELGLHVLAEGHTQEQIDSIVAMGCDTIGVNNRDFLTMNVSLETTLALRERVPTGRVLVSQSGIFERAEVEKLEAAGVDAVQVGTSLMKEGDIGAQLRKLLGA